MTIINKAYGSLLALMLFLLVFFNVNHNSFKNDEQIIRYIPKFVLVDKDVPVKQYFEYVDSIVTENYMYSSKKLTEHVLVRFNPWMIDTTFCNPNVVSIISIFKFDLK